LKAVSEFGGVDTISSAFVESAVNQVVSKRMIKKQQMRWAPRTAHSYFRYAQRYSTMTSTPPSSGGIQRWFGQPNQQRG
jgi:hypothetical protein